MMLIAKPTYIEMLFPTGESIDIQIGQPLRGIKHKDNRPSGFLVHHLEPVTITPILREWFFSEFYYCFDKDIFDTFYAIPQNKLLV